MEDKAVPRPPVPTLPDGFLLTSLQFTVVKEGVPLSIDDHMRLACVGILVAIILFVLGLWSTEKSTPIVPVVNIPMWLFIILVVGALVSSLMIVITTVRIRRDPKESAYSQVMKEIQDYFDAREALKRVHDSGHLD